MGSFVLILCRKVPMNLEDPVSYYHYVRAPSIAVLIFDCVFLQPHRISVRAVTPNRRTSRDAACTMVIGKDAPLAPSCIRATNVTSTSAVISWLPSNSNYQHVVCVNNVEVRVVKPGVYRHTITGWWRIDMLATI